MLDEEVLQDVLAAAVGGGGSWAEIFVEDRSTTALRLDDSRLEHVTAGREGGAGIRVVAGDSSSYAYTNVLTKESLLEVAAAAGAGLGASPGTVHDLRRSAAPAVHEVVRPPGDIDAEDKAAALREADDAARSNGPEVRQVVAGYADISQKVLIASSDGRIVEDERTRVRLTVSVVAHRGGNIASAHRAPGHSGGFELLDRHAPGEVAREAARRAVTMLEARPAPAGEFPVVLAAGTGGVLIHEACGHGLEADGLVKEASIYAGRRGDRFGKELVTIVDDATDAGLWGSYGVDDEGTPAQRTVLFEGGVLVGHLSDLRSAERIGGASTGNGRRQSYAHVPVVRMSNTHLLPGPDEAADILASVERGVYAASFAGGEVNPATGNFVFGMNEAYMIENGTIAYPIKGANLVGNGPRVLAAIEAVARDDFAVWEGVCGKDGQSAPVTTGMPTVLLSRMTVGGTEAP